MKLQAATESALSIPRSAVIDTGKEKIVYVVAGNGAFDKRVVQTGPSTQTDYAVVSGLKQGERVVTHGAFLIDSQSRLTGGMSGMFGGSKEFSDFKITLRVDPTPPKGGENNTVHVSVTDASGKPVSDAEVKVAVVMPAMPSMGMPEMRANADLSVTGLEYAGILRIPTAGSWNVIVEVRRGGQVIATYRTRFDAL